MAPIEISTAEVEFRTPARNCLLNSRNRILYFKRIDGSIVHALLNFTDNYERFLVSLVAH